MLVFCLLKCNKCKSQFQYFQCFLFLHNFMHYVERLYSGKSFHFSFIVWQLAKSLPSSFSFVPLSSKMTRSPFLKLDSNISNLDGGQSSLWPVQYTAQIFCILINFCLQSNTCIHGNPVCESTTSSPIRIESRAKWSPVTNIPVSFAKIIRLFAISGKFPYLQTTLPC